MKIKLTIVLFTLLTGLMAGSFVFADNSENSTGFAWSEKIGWIHFSGEDAGIDYGIKITNDQISGYVWSEKTGWISLNCRNDLTCNSQPYGVVSDGEGNLSGYAWSEKGGWINFNGVGSVEYQVQIDSNGNLSGYAWSEKVGWINTDDIGDNYGVTTVAGEGYCEDCVPCNPPVLNWNLDEGIGTTAYDSSFRGNNIYNNGTVAGGAVWQSQSECISGSCLYFDGSNDNVNRVYDTDLSFKGNSFSVGGWFKTSALTTPAYLFSRYDSAGWKAWLDADGDACFGIDDDSTWSGETPDDVVCTSGKNYDDNNWHYILAKKDAINGIYLYMDGTQVMSDTSLTATGSLSGTSPTFYTGVNSDGTTLPFAGFLDAIKIYDYARSADQIKQDYNEGTARIFSPRGTGAAIGGSSGTPLGDPILDLSFNEGQGSTAFDASGNNNHGTLVSGTTGGNTTTTAMWDKGGKKGGAMEFDGTDDMVAISNFQFPISNQFSMSQFINFKTLTAYRPIIGQWNNANQDNILLRLDNSNNDELRFCVANSLTNTCSNYGVTTDLNLAINQWRNVQIIYDGTQSVNADKLKLYVDGQKKTLSFTGTIPATIQITSTAGLSIGGNSGSYTNFLMDDLRIFSYALSEDEIKTLYNGSSAMAMGSDESRDNNGTEVTGANKDYCVPGDTAKCDKPVLELKMDEKSGTTTYDTSGNGNNGTINGATWESNGKAGSALNFDGSDDTLSTSYNSNLELPNSGGTIQAWVKFDNSLILGQDRTAGIFRKAINSNWLATGGYGLALYQAGPTDPHKLRGEFGPLNDVQIFASNSSLENNRWYNIVMKWDDVNIYLYIDGKLDSTTVKTKTISYSINTQPFMLGSQYSFINTGNRGYLNGSIDDVKIYDYARTSAQIAWDYDHGKEINHWKFDEGSGNTVHDEGLSRNDGTITGATWKNESECKNGKCLSFDGVDDYVEINPASNSTINLTGNDSISAWIYPTVSSGIMNIIDSQSAAGIENNQYNLYLDSNRKINRYLSGFCPSNSALSLNTWSHVLSTYDGSNLKIFINGVLDRTCILSKPSVTTNILRLGARSSSVYKFIGKIDDVKIYNYALTPLQVQQDYNNSSAVNFK